MRRRFTLIEVVVSLAVLGMAVVSAMSICSNAIARMEKAKSNWMNQHMISQAAESYLLAGPSSQPPHDIFPYKDVRASCFVGDASGLPEGVEAVSGQWRLATYEIQLSNASGQKFSTIRIDKIVQVNDK